LPSATVGCKREIEEGLMEEVMEDENIKAERATRKKGGRPPKKIKRCHIYMIRLTDLEQFTIAAKAKNAGTTISDFLGSPRKKRRSYPG
jgi:hypothetical protein